MIGWEWLAIWVACALALFAAMLPLFLMVAAATKKRPPGRGGMVE